MAELFRKRIGAQQIVVTRVANQGSCVTKSVFGLAAVGQIENDGFAVAFFAVIFIENRLRHHILFTGPIS